MKDGNDLVPQIDDHNMVQFLPLDATDEDSVDAVLSHLDNAIQLRSTTSIIDTYKERADTQSTGMASTRNRENPRT